MGRVSIKSIVLMDGKYEFRKENGVLISKRYGEQWRDFLGDHAVTLLFDRAQRLEASNKKLRLTIRKLLDELAFQESQHLRAKGPIQI